MSYFPEQQRPGMRRKSSAQNLLSSFKPTNSASTASIPPPLNLGTSPVGSSGAPLSFASVHQAATPTTTTPTAREWDAQSLHSDAAGSSLGGAGSPQIAQGMSVEYLREMVNKRMITLTYIRSVHEGRSHWFHTVQMTRADLDRAFNNFEMKKRTPRFAILALSLSSLLEINSPQDLLKSLLTTVSEYDQAKDDGDRSRMRFLKGRNARRGTNAGIPEYAGGYPETSDLSGLFSSNIPFALDYHETLISLIDVLSEVYNKISKLLGPSPFSAQANMVGPLGQLTPQPGVSYLFSGENVPTAVPSHNHSSSRHLSTANIHQLLSSSQSSSNEQPLSSSLWGIAHASLMAQGPGGLSSPPTGNWAPPFGEMLNKIDGKFKKIIGMLLKDLDDLARKSIQDELASLDPLLRNIAGPLENLPSSTRYEYGEAM